MRLQICKNLTTLWTSHYHILHFFSFSYHHHRPHTGLVYCNFFAFINHCFIDIFFLSEYYRFCVYVCIFIFNKVNLALLWVWCHVNLYVQIKNLEKVLFVPHFIEKRSRLFQKAIVMWNFRSNSLIKSLTCKCSGNGSKTLFEQGWTKKFVTVTRPLCTFLSSLTLLCQLLLLFLHTG